jgi:glutathione S-transferase
MSIELWFHHEASAFVRKPLLVAYELGITLAEQRVDFMSPDAMHEYATLNPNRKFPTLRDDDLVLWESNAILGYLAAMHGPHLLGGNARDRARVQQWLFWELAHFGPAILGLSNLRLGFLPRPTRTAESLEADLASLCALLDGALASRSWLVGENVTIADFAIAADFTFAEDAGLPVTGYRDLTGWRARMRERDAWQKTEARKEEILRKYGVR